MKRFLQKIALRLLLLAVIWIIVGHVMPRRYYMGHEYLRWETLFQAIAGRHEKPLPKNLIIGDSGAEMGLDAKELRAANFAIGGTSFPEGYYILHQLQDVDIDTLFMSYGQFHFQSMDCFYTRSQFFGFIEPDFIEEVIELAQATRDTIYSRKTWQWLNVLDASFHFDAVEREFRFVHNLYEHWHYKWYFREGEATRDSMIADQYSFLVPAPKSCPKDSTNMTKVLEEKEGHFRVTPVNAHYLSKILRECQDRGIQVVWLNMPLSTGTAQPSTAYFDEYHHALNMLMPEDAPIVPYRRLDRCDFRDFAHLHRGAARAHTQWIRGYLRDSIHSIVAPKTDSLP